MKNLFTFLVCFLGVTTAWAQRYVNIELTVLSPAANFSYVEGGNVLVSLSLKNLGPDTLLATDSVAVRFIDGQTQILGFANGKTWLGFKARELQPNDTMHIDTVITTTNLLQPNFFKGQICIDAYPCADSIGALWNNNMDTGINMTNNLHCGTITMIPTSVGATSSMQQSTNVYPNPATGILHIEAADVPGARVTIINTQGANVGTATHHGKGQFTYNTALLAAGVYFAQIKNDVYQRVVRFVKE